MSEQGENPEAPISAGAGGGRSSRGPMVNPGGETEITSPTPPYHDENPAERPSTEEYATPGSAGDPDTEGGEKNSVVEPGEEGTHR
jgi:hypothetical protein